MVLSSAVIGLQASSSPGSSRSPQAMPVEVRGQVRGEASQTVRQGPSDVKRRYRRELPLKAGEDLAFRPHVQQTDRQVRGFRQRDAERFRPGHGPGAGPGSGAAGVSDGPQLQENLRVQMGRTVQVDQDISSCAEASGPPHDVEEGGKIRLGKAAGDFEGHESGIDIHTDKYTQLMVHGVLQRDTSKSQLHNSVDDFIRL